MRSLSLRSGSSNSARKDLSWSRRSPCLPRATSCSLVIPTFLPRASAVSVSSPTMKEVASDGISSWLATMAVTNLAGSSRSSFPVRPSCGKIGMREHRAAAGTLSICCRVKAASM